MSLPARTARLLAVLAVVAVVGTTVYVVKVPRYTPTGIPKNKAGIDQAYGELTLGKQYTEGAGGRINVMPAWVAQHIVKVKLCTGQTVQINKAIADEFVALWQAAYDAAGWAPKVVQTFVPRHILWNAARPLSLHSWGVAFDVDPSKNPWGSGSNNDVGKHPDWIKVWTNAGWSWGGNWKPTKDASDPMHFQRKQRG